jgi:PTH1 family peptidyl-tRNA hydrolase
MNLSGQSVQRVANYYKIPPNAILIAHDEVDLGVGDTRLKWDGGDGGHNGVKDIIRHLATKQFLRLRIGVGRPHHKNGVEEYVLMPPKKIEFDDIMRSLVNAYDILPLLLAGQVQKAMHQLHTEG